MRKILLLFFIVVMWVHVQAAPKITKFTVGSTSTNTGQISYSITANNAGPQITGFWVTNNASVPQPSANTPGWLNPTSANSFAGTFSLNGTYQLDLEGKHMLYAWAKDISGNVSQRYVITTASFGGGSNFSYIIYDKTLPVISAFTLPKSTVSPAISMGITATDNNSVTGYFISESNSTPAVNSLGWSATVPTSFTLTHEGSTTLALWVKDIAGNVSVVKTATVTYNVAPVITAFAIEKNSTLPTVPVVIAASDNLAVTGYYLVADNSTAPPASAAGWNATKPASITLASEGLHSVYLWVKDAAGNISQVKSATVDYQIPEDNLIGGGVNLAGGSVDTPTSAGITAYNISFSAPSKTKEATIPLTISVTNNSGAPLVSGEASYYLSETGTFPQASSTEWTKIVPTTYTFSNEGVYTLNLGVKDPDGNIGINSISVTYDRTTPVISSFTAPSTTITATVSLAINATDNIGVTDYYLVADNSTAPTASATVWSPNKPASITLDSEGSRTLYLWAKDAAGNISTVASAVVFYDKTAPVATLTCAATSTLATVPVTVTATDNVAVTGYYLVADNSAAPAASSTNWAPAKPASVDLASEGSHTLYLWVKDAAGNISTVASAVVFYDKTAPVATLTCAATSTLATVPVTVTATDNVAVTGYYLVADNSAAPAASSTNWAPAKPSSVDLASEGNHTLYLWVKDAAGNISALKSVTVLYDKTAPVVNSYSTTSYYTTDVTIPIEIDASDNVGITAYYLSEIVLPEIGWPAPPSLSSTVWKAEKPSSYTLTNNGKTNRYLGLYVRDAAGNLSALQLFTVVYDITAPVISSFTAPSSSTTATVSLAINATDNVEVTGYYLSESSTIPTLSLADWKIEKPTSYTFSQEGNHTLYLWVKDASDNISVLKSVTVIYDKTAPVISSFTAPSATNTATVSLEITATDNLGVTGYYLSESSTVPTLSLADWKPEKPTSYTFGQDQEGSHTLYLWVKDRIGNVSAVASATVVYDKTAPVATLACAATSNLATVPVTITVTENGSGITGYYLVADNSAAPTASATGWDPAKPASITLASEGSHTLYLWVKDAAGCISTVKSVSVFFDKTVPVISSFTASAANKATVSLAIDATDNVGVTGYYLSENSTVPTISSAGWKPEKPTSYTFSKEGNITLYLWVKDAAGNVSTVESIAVIYDITAPKISTFIVPSLSNNSTVSVIIDATDNVGVTGYYLSENSNVPALSSADWKPKKPTSFTFTKGGTDFIAALYLTVRDAAGNLSYKKLEVTIDKSVPVITSLVIEPPKRGSDVTVVSMTSATDGWNMGAFDQTDLYYYYLSVNSTTPALNADGWKRWVLCFAMI